MSAARVARYAEVIRRTEQRRGLLADVDIPDHYARAVMAVADAEQAEQRAEFERQRDLAQRNFKQGAALLVELQAAEAKLRDVEAERDALRAVVRDVETLVERMPRPLGSILRAVLARSQSTNGGAS